MLRLLADQNFNNDVVRGVRLRKADAEFVRAQDFNLSQAEDTKVLAWAAENDYIVATHDRATMPDFAYERVLAGQPMPGVFVISDRLAVRDAIDELLLVYECSTPADWSGRVVHLPL